MPHTDDTTKSAGVLQPVKFSRLTSRGIILGLSLPQMIALGIGDAPVGRSTPAEASSSPTPPRSGQPRRPDLGERSAAGRWSSGYPSAPGGYGAPPADSSSTGAGSSPRARRARSRCPAIWPGCANTPTPRPGRDDPRPAPRRHAHRRCRRRPSRVRAAGPLRAAAPRHRVGPCARHCLPLRADRHPPSRWNAPCPIPGRGSAEWWRRTRHRRQLLGRDHLCRVDRPGRARWGTSRDHRVASLDMKRGGPADPHRRRRHQGAANVLRQEMTTLISALRAADLDHHRMAVDREDRGHPAHRLRSRYRRRPWNATASSARTSPPPGRSRSPRPGTRLRTDCGYHAVLWITEWPRVAWSTPGSSHP